MNEILITIISAVVTLVIMPLLTFICNKLLIWIGTKIKNEEAERLTEQAVTTIQNAVKAVLQVYVDALKKEGKFDEEAQEIALAKARTIVNATMTAEIKDYIKNTYGDYEFWILTQIEACIHTLRKPN